MKKADYTPIPIVRNDVTQRCVVCRRYVCLTNHDSQPETEALPPDDAMDEMPTQRTLAIPTTRTQDAPEVSTINYQPLPSINLNDVFNIPTYTNVYNFKMPEE